MFACSHAKLATATDSPGNSTGSVAFVKITGAQDVRRYRLTPNPVGFRFAPG